MSRSVRAFLSRLGAVFGSHRKGPGGLPRGDGGPSPDADRGQPARRYDTSRGPANRAGEIRRPGVGARSLSGSPQSSPIRGAGPRLPLRPSHVAQEPGLHFSGSDYARRGHRRQHRAVQSRGRCPDSSLALSQLRQAGGTRRSRTPVAREFCSPIPTTSTGSSAARHSPIWPSALGTVP